MTAHLSSRFVQLWNEFGCVRCKAGLCPAYVPPVDNDGDQQQDLPPKGRAVRPTAGKFSSCRKEASSLAVFERGWGHMPSSSLTSVHLTSETHHRQQVSISIHTQNATSSLTQSLWVIACGRLNDISTCSPHTSHTFFALWVISNTLIVTRSGGIMALSRIPLTAWEITSYYVYFILINNLSIYCH